MADTEPTGGHGTEHEDRDAEGTPDIGTAGAFPALANDALAKDPDVPTDVDGDPVPGGEPDLRDA